MSNPFQLAYSGRWRYCNGEVTFLAMQKFHGQLPSCDKTVFLNVGFRGLFHAYFLKSEMRRSAESGLQLLSDHKLVCRLVAAAQASAQSLISHGAMVEKTEVNDLANEELDRSFHDNNRAWIDLAAFYCLSNEEFSKMAEYRLRSWLSNKVFDANDVLRCLTGGDGSGLDSFKERRYWASLCQQYCADRFDNQRRKRLLDRYVKLFGHLGVSVDRPKGWTYGDCLRRLTSTTREEVALLQSSLEMEEYRNLHSDSLASGCATRLGMDEQLFSVARSMALLSINRLALREAALFNYRCRENLMAEIYSRIDILSGKVILHRLRNQLSIKEISQALRFKTKPSVDLLEDRLSSCAIELRDGQIYRYDGPQETTRYQTIVKNVAIRRGHGSSFKGTLLSGRGTVIGKVAVLGTEESNDIVEQGKGIVIVTPMLRPDMVISFRNAIAIVTEEGGLTSHAAVLTREWGLLCIASIRGVTRLVKNGDWVKVSASSATVQLLTRAEVEALGTADAGVERSDRSSETESADSHSSSKPKSPTLTYSEQRVITLDSPEASQTPLVGHKAANLHELLDWAPKGFVITVPVVKEWLARLADGGTSEYMTEHSKSLYCQIQPYLTNLDERYVIVRSSHPEEDSSKATYAGLFRSYVNVDSLKVDSLVRAIIGVAISAESDYVLDYHHVSGGVGSTRGIAVLIQPMIETKLSGIALTKLTRRGRSWAVIEYGLGSFSAHASGRTTPSQATLPRSVFQNYMRGGRVSEDRLVPPGLERFLTESSLQSLLRTIIAVERQFGCPQEIEWGVDMDDRVYVFQSRPLTS